MKTNLLSLFSVPVCVVRDFISNEQCVQLFDFAKSNLSEFNKHSSLYGDSLSSHSSTKFFLDVQPIQNLKNRIEDQLNIFSNNVGFQKTKITNSWINIQNKGSILETHVHASSFLSGALYIHADEDSSRIFFFNPNPLIAYTPLNEEKVTSFNNSYYYLKPIKGDLIIFPSWLQHGSARDENRTENRMVLSFNTTPISACSSVG